MHIQKQYSMNLIYSLKGLLCFILNFSFHYSVAIVIPFPLKGQDVRVL